MSYMRMTDRISSRRRISRGNGTSRLIESSLTDAISKDTHGTGCSLASAIASNLAKGFPLVKAVESGCTYISNGIATAPGFGAGNGPIDHLHSHFMSPFAPGKFIDYVISRQDVKEKWKAYTQHEFVKQLGAGTLDIEAFKFYLIQDYLFLVTSPTQILLIIINR